MSKVTAAMLVMVLGVICHPPTAAGKEAVSSVRVAGVDNAVSRLDQGGNLVGGSVPVKLDPDAAPLESTTRPGPLPPKDAAPARELKVALQSKNRTMEQQDPSPTSLEQVCRAMVESNERLAGRLAEELQKTREMLELRIRAMEARLVNLDESLAVISESVGQVNKRLEEVNETAGRTDKKVEAVIQGIKDSNRLTEKLIRTVHADLTRAEEGIRNMHRDLEQGLSR